MAARANILAAGKGVRRVYLALRRDGLVARDVTLRQWATHEASWRRPVDHHLYWLSEACWGWLERKRAISKGRGRRRQDFFRRAHPRQPIGPDQLVELRTMLVD